MTSIEWLIEQLETKFEMEVYTKKLSIIDIIEQAKEMHKQEIIDTYLLDELDSSKKYAEQYYQETFGSKDINGNEIKFIQSLKQPKKD